MIAAFAAAPAASTNKSLLSVHFWHGVEALAFIVITLVGVGFAEWWQRRGKPPGARPASTERSVTGYAPRALMTRIVPARRSGAFLATAALTCTAAAGIHYVVMPEHFDESTLYGVFFLVTATSQVGYSVLLAFRPSRPLLAAGVIANAAVVALWLMTRLVEIPLGPGSGSRESFGGLDVLASSFEVVCVVSAAALLLSAAALPSPRRMARVLTQTSSVAAALLVAAAIGVTAYLQPPS